MKKFILVELEENGEGWTALDNLCGRIRGEANWQGYEARTADVTDLMQYHGGVIAHEIDYYGLDWS